MGCVSISPSRAPGCRGVPSKDKPSFQRAPFLARAPRPIYGKSPPEMYPPTEGSRLKWPVARALCYRYKKTCTCFCRDTAESQPAYAD